MLWFIRCLWLQKPVWKESFVIYRRWKFISSLEYSRVDPRSPFNFWRIPFEVSKRALPSQTYRVHSLIAVWIFYWCGFTLKWNQYFEVDDRGLIWVQFKYLIWDSVLFSDSKFSGFGVLNQSVSASNQNILLKLVCLQLYGFWIL